MRAHLSADLVRLENVFIAASFSVHEVMRLLPGAPLCRGARQSNVKRSSIPAASATDLRFWLHGLSLVAVLAGALGGPGSAACIVRGETYCRRGGADREVCAVRSVSIPVKCRVALSQYKSTVAGWNVLTG
jgi:hypothetical protein